MGIKIIAKNKRAYFDFKILDTFETGMVLEGTEVKSLRSGKASIGEAYIHVDKKGEAWAYNINIPHYEFGNINNHEERRKRKLLLHLKELEEIAHRVSAERLAIVPTKIYFKGSKVKLEIGLGKGKQQHDKRQDEAKKSVEKKLRQRDYE